MKKKFFFSYTSYNNTYLAVMKIERFPYTCASDYLSNLCEYNATPFVVFKNACTLSPTALSTIANNLRILHDYTGIAIEEIKEMDKGERKELFINSTHQAIYGFVLIANSPKKLFNNYERIKEDLKINNITISQTDLIDYDFINFLKQEKIVDAQNVKNVQLTLSHMAKSDTDMMISLINEFNTLKKNMFVNIKNTSIE